MAGVISAKRSTLPPYSPANFFASASCAKLPMVGPIEPWRLPPTTYTAVLASIQWPLGAFQSAWPMSCTYTAWAARTCSPASGAALGWLLLTTLWLPLLDYARSYAPQASQLASALGPEPGCVQMVGLSRAQVAALQYHASLRLQPASRTTDCPWLVADNEAWPAPENLVNPDLWTREATIGRPTDRKEFILLFRRAASPD